MTSGYMQRSEISLAFRQKHKAIRMKRTLMQFENHHNRQNKKTISSSKYPQMTSGIVRLSPQSLKASDWRAKCLSSAVKNYIVVEVCPTRRAHVLIKWTTAPMRLSIQMCSRVHHFCRSVRFKFMRGIAPRQQMNLTQWIILRAKPENPNTKIRISQ